MKFVVKYFLVVVLLKCFEAAPVVQDGSFVFPTDNELDLSEILMTPEERSSVNLEQDENVALESGKYFQGDIKLLPDQQELLLSNVTDEGLLTRTGVLLESQRWSKNHLGKVVVPFTFKRESDYSESKRVCCLVFEMINSRSKPKRNRT